jgi:hypothetical protein
MPSPPVRFAEADIAEKRRGRRVLILAWLLALAFSLMCIFGR